MHACAHEIYINRLVNPTDPAGTQMYTTNYRHVIIKISEIVYEQRKQIVQTVLLYYMIFTWESKCHTVGNILVNPPLLPRTLGYKQTNKSTNK